MIELSRKFIQQHCQRYDQHAKREDLEEERAIRAWLEALPERKFLDKKYFVRLGRWKTPRQTPAYELSDEALVTEVTRLAYELSNERLKLHVLKALNGVDVTVAACILHFLHPDEFPLFDHHARSTLKRAGKWNRDVDDASDSAWQDYVAVMRELADRLGVSLRELDKALFAYDKWGTTGDPSLRSG